MAKILNVGSPRASKPVVLVYILVILGAVPAGAMDSDFSSFTAQVKPGMSNEQKIDLYHAALQRWQAADGEARRTAVRQSLAVCLAIKAWEPFNSSKTKATAEANLERNEALCREAITLWPDFANPWRTLAYTYHRAERYAESVPLYREALRRPNPPTDTHLLLAQAYEGLKDWAALVELLSPYLPAAANSLPHRQVAGALRALGRYQEALAVNEAFLARKDTQPEGLQVALNSMEWLESLDRTDEVLRFGRLYRDRGGDTGVEAFNLPWFQAHRRRGFDCLLARDWDGALADYGEAAASLKTWPKLARLDKGYRANVAEMLRLAKDLKALGSTKPVHTFRILALTLARVDASFTDLFGKPVTYRLPALDLATLPWRQKAQAFLALCVEAWSGGKLALAFEEQAVDATIRGFRLNWMGGDSASGKEMHTADLASVEPSILPLLQATQNRYDAYIIYYNGQDGAGAGLHGWVYQLPMPGGGKSPVKRGHLDIPLNFIAHYDGPAILVHEFFHILEGLAGIQVLHGYLPENRKHFAAWTGEGEFDFYRWHFRKTLAVQGWENAGFVKRWPAP